MNLGANCWDIQYLHRFDDGVPNIKLNLKTQDCNEIVSLFKTLKYRDIISITPIYIQETSFDKITDDLGIVEWFGYIKKEDSLKRLKDQILHHHDEMERYKKELTKELDKE